jgi:hypothetical protein
MTDEQLNQYVEGQVRPQFCLASVDSNYWNFLPRGLLYGSVGDVRWKISGNMHMIYGKLHYHWLIETNKGEK